MRTFVTPTFEGSRVRIINDRESKTGSSGDHQWHDVHTNMRIVLLIRNCTRAS
jgi:hypothetical protein